MNSTPVNQCSATSSNYRKIYKCSWRRYDRVKRYTDSTVTPISASNHDFRKCDGSLRKMHWSALAVDKCSAHLSHRLNCTVVIVVRCFVKRVSTTQSLLDRNGDQHVCVKSVTLYYAGECVHVTCSIQSASNAAINDHFSQQQRRMHDRSPPVNSSEPCVDACCSPKSSMPTALRSNDLLRKQMVDS